MEIVSFFVAMLAFAWAILRIVPKYQEARSWQEMPKITIYNAEPAATESRIKYYEARNRKKIGDSRLRSLWWALVN